RHAVVLRGDAELGGDRADGAVRDRGDERVLLERVVALVVAHVDRVEREADERSEADVGEGDRDRVAPAEALEGAELVVVLEDDRVEDEEVEEVAELDAQRDGDREAAEVPVPELEGVADAVAGGEAAALLQVLRL